MVNEQEGSAQVENASGVQDKKDAVSYESYSRLLSQHKKSKEENDLLKSQLNSFLEEKKKIEETKLMEQGEYKKLIEARENRIAEAEKRARELEEIVSNVEREKVLAKKIMAFNSKLPSKLAKEEYYSLVDFDQIAFDPINQQVDKSSLEQYTSSFIEKFGNDLLVKKQTRMPNEAATSGDTKIDYDAWIKMPYSEKKKYRFEDIKNVK